MYKTLLKFRNAMQLLLEEREEDAPSFMVEVDGVLIPPANVVVDPNTESESEPLLHCVSPKNPTVPLNFRLSAFHQTNHAYLSCGRFHNLKDDEGVEHVIGFYMLSRLWL